MNSLFQLCIFNSWYGAVSLISPISYFSFPFAFTFIHLQRHILNSLGFHDVHVTVHSYCSRTCSYFSLQYKYEMDMVVAVNESHALLRRVSEAMFGQRQQDAKESVGRCIASCETISWLLLWLHYEKTSGR